MTVYHIWNNLPFGLSRPPLKICIKTL